MIPEKWQEVKKRERKERLLGMFVVLAAAVGSYYMVVEVNTYGILGWLFSLILGVRLSRSSKETFIKREEIKEELHNKEIIYTEVERFEFKKKNGEFPELELQLITGEKRIVNAEIREENVERIKLEEIILPENNFSEKEKISLLLHPVLIVPKKNK